MIRHNLKVAFDDDDNPKRGDNSSIFSFSHCQSQHSLFSISTNATGISRHDLKFPICQSFFATASAFFPSTPTFVSLLSCFNYEMTQQNSTYFTIHFCIQSRNLY